MYSVVKNLVVTTICYIVTMTLMAETEIVGGIEWTYTVDDGKATLSNDCIGQSTTGAITIPSTLGGFPVAYIGESAFQYCHDLASVVIPDSVTSIERWAFAQCSSLTSMTIPNNVTNIGVAVFGDCSSLTNVTMPDGLSSIGDSAFAGCSGLTSVTIPDGLSSIGDFVFSGCSGLTSVTIPDSVKNIGDGAFWDCGGLTSVTIPDSVTNIGVFAFYDCSGLSSVTIPDSVTSIGESAFFCCGSLMSFAVGENNPNYKSVDGLLLSKDGTTLIQGVNGDVAVPDSVNEITGGAFRGCRGLTSVSVPGSVASIGDLTFYGCSGLMSFNVSEDNPNYKSVDGLLLSKDGTMLVQGVNGNVVIPDSVTIIGVDAFLGYGGLMSITVGEGNSNYKSVDGLLLSNDGKTLIQGINGDVTIPDSVTSIEGMAFEGRSGLMSVIITESVTNIGVAAFFNCSGLTSMTIPASVTSVGSIAFGNCSGLTSVYVSAGDADRIKGLMDSSGSDLIGVSFVEIDETLIIFDANGGSVNESNRSALLGAAVGELPIPSRVGYNFVGWFTAANGGVQISASTIVSGAVTYYAHWVVDVGERFSDSVDITIAARVGATKTLINFPALVRISEARMPGFFYSRIGTGGLIFVDSAGNLLPYEIDTWDASGESLVWVRIPELPPTGAKIRMYWNPKEGRTVPENDPTAVWVDTYAGVWHMKESVTAFQAATAISYDSTTNKNDAMPKTGMSSTANLSQMVSVSGAIGNGRQNSSTASVQRGNRLETTKTQDFGGVFTFSGWFKMNARGNYPRLAGTKTGNNSADGWSVETAPGSSTSLYLRGNGASYFQPIPVDDLLDNWVFLTFVYSNATASVYSNGKFVRSGTITQVKDSTQPLSFGAHGSGDEWSLNGAYDEIRITGQVLSAEWIEAEYATVDDESFVAPSSPVYCDGLKLNYWVDVPTMDKTTWDVLETPGVLTTEGEIKYGSFTNVIYSVYDPTRTFTSTAELTEEGAYRIEFFSTLTEEDGYEPVRHTIDIRVITGKPYTKIAGTSGNSGRVLLMNRDTNTKCPIDWQGYNDTQPRRSTYWEHLNTDGEYLPYNLQVGTESMLMTMGGTNRLWHLVDCRHGNTYPDRSDADLSEFQNYLPYSSTSKSFMRRLTVANQSTAGQVVMRNMEDATIYSSCFTNGIGTIYFDAVNGWARDGENFANYKLVVEIATNAVKATEDGFVDLPPTDDNSYSTTEVRDDETGELISVTTNWYGNLEGQWTLVAMIPYKRDTTNLVEEAAFVKGEPTTELTLDVEHGGTMDNFFRVVVPLDITGPVRFRIRRTTEVPHSGSSLALGVDEGGFILLDNIIASLPAMRGDLVSAGHFDEEKSGGQTLGWELATSVPYPAATDSVVTGSAVPEYYVNVGDGTEVDTRGFFASATMHYRWRYLNQQMGDWKSVDLNPTDFRALAPLELPGRTCDVEYWFEYALQAPFYEYVDFSGLGKLIDYTEERGVLTNRLGGAVQASGGTDWYFRVRDGQSPYAGLDIVFRRGESERVERAHMALVGDHVWRGFIQTKEDQTGEVSYRVEALDYQTEPFADYAASTNYWYSAMENPSFPVCGSVDQDGTVNSWSKLTLDAATGYVMFQVDDRTRSLTVAHAEYQDFNKWDDALGRLGRDGSVRTVGPVFVDTSSVSPTKQTFAEDFSDWQTMPVTNNLWGQMPTFSDIQPSHLLGRTAYESFSFDTDGPWSVGKGMWVAKKYADQRNNKGVALQMEGNGNGYLQFTDRDAAPRGIGSVSFNARIGQVVRFEDFAYYYGGLLGLSNYTFMARTAFDLNKNQNFAGNASLSLVANYLPNKGCYEARWEWLGNRDSTTLPGLRLCLYRWNVINGAKRSELIIARTNTSDFAINQVTSLAPYNSNLFLPMFISVSNDIPNRCTYVVAGVRRSGLALGVASPIGSGANWLGVCFKDTDQTKQLTKGTYGVLSANCEGVFARPEFSHTVQTTVGNFPGSSSKSSFSNTALNDIANLQDIKNCAEQDLQDPECPGWNIIPGRMKVAYENINVNAVLGDTVAQQLQIYLGAPGGADWGTTPACTLLLHSFGSSSGGSQYTIPFYSTTAGSIKFAVAGTSDDIRADVVLDSVAMTQWRGGDWNDDNQVNGVSECLPAWADANHRSDPNAFSNFVFTSCWVTNHAVLMSAKRSNLDTPCAIRSPLMDGFQRGDGTSRGKGLGMMSVEYANAQENVVLELQIATNNVSTATIDAYDKSFDPAVWTTIADFDFSAMTAAQRKSGVLNCCVGLHNVTGAMRILMSTNVVQSVANEVNPARFGDVTITRIVCRDEPPIDIHSWWGFNMRTIGGDNDSEKRMLLSDFGMGAGAAGLSLALNNSVDADYNISRIDVSDRESYIRHKPFVQTPTFTSNIVGEVSFKARKYASTDAPATVVLFGSNDTSETDDGTWHRIDGAVFSVTNDWYETYSYKTDPSQHYRAFRLAVVGVAGVTEDASGGGNALPPSVSSAERVLLDEIFVSEAVMARIGFKNVGCFKSDIAGTEEVPNVPSLAEQPHCNEVWGVQCEVYGAQLADDMDFSKTPQVRLHWFNGASPWGYENWKNLDGCHSAWLSLTSGAGDGRYVYRTSLSGIPESVVPMSTSSPSCVQYMLEVVYYQKGSTVPTTNILSSADWMIPEWYSSLGSDIQEGLLSGSFTAFNIIDDTVPPSATATQTTPVPVPYADLDDRFVSYLEKANGDYEAAAKMNGRNGYAIWQSYLAGLVPDDDESKLLARIEMVDGAPVVTWEPDLNTNGIIRVYKVYGKETLEGEWQYPTNSLHRFFKVTVEMP